MKTILISLVVLTSAAAAQESRQSYVKRELWVQSMLATRRQLLETVVPDGQTRRDESVRRTSRGNAGAQMERLLRRFWNDFPETDWFLQDQPYRDMKGGVVQPQRDFGWYFRAGRQPEGERAMIRRVLNELPAEHSFALSRELEQLQVEGAGVDDAAWLELYVEACRLRRQLRLQSLARRVPSVVFAKHYTLGGSHYAYTEGQSDAQAERHFCPGAALCVLTWDGRRFVERTLLRDPAGVIRDPDVSYDGQRILFSWKKSDRNDDYHLYEMKCSTAAVRQLTFGQGVADYEGVYLPTGDIIFNSTRCVQTVDCWWTEVSNLYRCDGEGKLLRRLAFDQVHDNYPTVTPDGRILYTRWEYNDRGQVYPQPLLQMNPDGTNQSEFYGGNSWFPTTILHARAIPGTNKVLAIATGHHSRQTGKLIELDPSRGRQENDGAMLVAPERDTPNERVDAYGQQGELFQYPYPLNDNEYLVSYHPVGWPWAEGALGPRFGLYYMTRDGGRELLAIDVQLPCGQPVPLTPRRIRHVRPSRVDYRQTKGTCYIQDVYAGPGLTGVPRGAVRRLRVVSLDFRAAGIGSNRNEGPGGGALISTPVAIGNGAWDPKTILGDATVYDDGSVYFQLPARTPVYFQLLDQRGCLIQSMRSWTTLQPGENASCVGCHEHKNSVPAAHLSLSDAMRAGAETLRPFYGPPRGFSFTNEVQPILDEHCVRCHDGKSDVPYDLTSRPVEDPLAKRFWSRAYLSLTHARPDDRQRNECWRGDPDHPLVSWIGAQSAPPMLTPCTAGSGCSMLMDLLRAGHEDVRLSLEELDKFSAWIDLGVPFCGDYREGHAWDAEELAKYQHFLRKRQQYADTQRDSISASVEPVSVPGQ